MVQQVRVTSESSDADDREAHLPCPCVHDLAHLVLVTDGLVVIRVVEYTNYFVGEKQNNLTYSSCMDYHVRNVDLSQHLKTKHT